MNKNRSKQETMGQFNERKFGTGTKGSIFMPSQELIGVAKKAMPDFEKEKENKKLREERILKYNSTIEVLDEDYTSPESFGYFIVRAYHIEPTFTEGGLETTQWLKRRVLVESGNGVKEEVESQWQFSTRAVVISIPRHLHIKSEDLKVGDTVQIDKEIILPKSQGLREGVENVMVYSYTLPEWTSPIAPTDLESKHFGYFKVPREALITKLKSA